MGHRYSTYRLTEDFIFYHAGVEREAFGQYFSFEKPISVLQTRIDKAIPPVWPNGSLAILDTSFTIKIPKGTIVHVGDATHQGRISLGGTRQIVIKKPRNIFGIEIIEEIRVFGAKSVRK